MLKVQRKQCRTCIYHPGQTASRRSIEELENEVRDPYIGFKGHRVCHHSDGACCRGFWDRHKDEFPAGQIAQRLGLVQFVDEDVLSQKEGKTLAAPRGHWPRGKPRHNIPAREWAALRQRLARVLR